MRVCASSPLSLWPWPRGPIMGRFCEKHSRYKASSLASFAMMAYADQYPGEETATWEEWVQHETAARTKYIVFCSLQSPPHRVRHPTAHPRLGNQDEAPFQRHEFKAETEVKWRTPEQKLTSRHNFRKPYASFSAGAGRLGAAFISGSYILIHAIIQQIFFSDKRLGADSIP